MVKYYKLITIAFIALTVSACASNPHSKKITTTNWAKANQQFVEQYNNRVERQLAPFFQKAGVAYPPKQLTLLAFKQEEKVEVWAKDHHNQWRHIKNYHLTSSLGGLGPKLLENDHKIPEGIYKITHFNPFSKLHLSMMLNYPNDFDRKHASKDGRTQLGGEIFIHGKHSSAGCLSIGDRHVSQLYVLVNRVGKQNVEVVIAPNDLRKAAPKTQLAQQPQWVPELYSKLNQKLQNFS